MRKKKINKPLLMKVSRIDCDNGSLITIGQLRNNETHNWVYAVTNPMGEPVVSGECPDKQTAFQEALSKSYSNS